MRTLLLSSWSLPASRALATAAGAAGWNVAALTDQPRVQPIGKVVYYGTTDAAVSAASLHGLALLEPPLDLLARLPVEMRCRRVEFGSFNDLNRLKGPAFVKPADALHKAFDVGVYSNPAAIRNHQTVPANTPVLVADAVQWQAEYRCFVLERRVAAWSRYLSFGRPVWKPFPPTAEPVPPPPGVSALCQRLFSRCGHLLPPACVVDVGVMENHGWGVVEFNPVWCSGVLGADPRKVLAVLDRASQAMESLSAEDQRWLVQRSGKA